MNLAEFLIISYFTYVLVMILAILGVFNFFRDIEYRRIIKQLVKKPKKYSTVFRIYHGGLGGWNGHISDYTNDNIVEFLKYRKMREEKYRPKAEKLLDVVMEVHYGEYIYQPKIVINDDDLPPELAVRKGIYKDKRTNIGRYMK